MGKFYLIAFFISAVIIWLGLRARLTARLFAGQTCLVAGWYSIIAVTMLFFFMPIFKMGEVVYGGYLGPKSEFTHIQFITDALFSTNQLFMQRSGEDVILPQVAGERWTTVSVASGTNKAFVIVCYDSPQPTNTAFCQWNPWWPSRGVEISLPMTNEPLTNFTLRTLWTCKTKPVVQKGDLLPVYINSSSWDGRYLMVSSRRYASHLNFRELDQVNCVYDVEQERFLSVPLAEQ